MKKSLVLLVAAALAALVLASGWEPMPIEARRISIEAQKAFPELSGRAVPIDVQAQLLDFADDEVLLLKARAAVIARPDMAARILPRYGDQAEFRQILRRYGDTILPPIAHFLDNEIATLALADAIRRAGSRVLGRAGATADPAAATPEDRGWRAVGFILREGHDFLGQFEVDANGVTHWIHTERVLEGLASLFAGGMRDLERKYRSGAEIAASDLGWAAADAVAALGAVAILRAGKAAATAVRSGEAGSRVAAGAARLARAGKIGLAGAGRAKWPAILAAAYIAVRHPGSVSDLLAGLADSWGLPAPAVIFGGWLLLLLPLLHLAMPILQRATGLLLTLLRLLRNALAWIEHGPHRQRP